MNHLTYNHCINSLHYIYQILGEDAFMEEVAFLRHGKQKEIDFLKTQSSVAVSVPSISVPKESVQKESVPKESVPSPKQDKIIVHKTNEVVEDVPEEIPQKKKYSRAIVPDQDRCRAIISTGGRCTCTKVNQDYCNRHTPK
jgi:hypothetical protein